MAFFANKKLFVQCRRNIRRLDNAYNFVTTPITFCEISLDDVSDKIPCKDMITCCVANIPNFETVHTVYDTLSVNKDILESIVALCKQSKKIKDMNDKNKVIYVLKCLSLLYKTIIANSSFHEEHSTILNILDYLNFLISCY